MAYLVLSGGGGWRSRARRNGGQVDAIQADSEEVVDDTSASSAAAGEQPLLGGDPGGGRLRGGRASRRKWRDTRGNGDPSGLSFAPGHQERREEQQELFRQKIQWRHENPIENVSFGFLYYLGSPKPGNIEQSYIRELGLSLHALSCSSFEQKNVVVVTDTEESKQQLKEALQGHPEITGEGVAVQYRVVELPFEVRDDPVGSRNFLDALESCRRSDLRAVQKGSEEQFLCYRVQMTLKVFALAQSPFQATLAIDNDVYVNFLLMPRRTPR